MLKSASNKDANYRFTEEQNTWNSGNKMNCGWINFFLKFEKKKKAAVITKEEKLKIS